MTSEEVKPCRWCAEPHAGDYCPIVKALEFSRDINGAEFVSRVEFLTPADVERTPRKEAPQPQDYPRSPPLKEG